MLGHSLAKYTRRCDIIKYFGNIVLFGQDGQLHAYHSHVAVITTREYGVVMRSAAYVCLFVCPVRAAHEPADQLAPHEHTLLL